MIVTIYIAQVKIDKYNAVDNSYTTFTCPPMANSDIDSLKRFHHKECQENGMEFESDYHSESGILESFTYKKRTGNITEYREVSIWTEVVVL